MANRYLELERTVERKRTAQGPSDAPQVALASSSVTANRRTPGSRPCCALGQWTIGMAGALDPTALGGHRYGAAGGPVGYVYTGRSGLIDLGHLRDLADMVKFVHDALAGGATTLDLFEGTAIVSTIPTGSSLLDLAASIAYVDSWGHELSTWPDYSSFSPEDIPSNICGVEVGKRAITAGGSFDAAVDSSLRNLLNVELGARPQADTDAVLTKIKDDWWKRVVAAPPFALLRRNFDGDGWMAGMPFDARASLPWLAPGAFAAQYANFSYTMKGTVNGKAGVTLATMQTTTDALRASWVAANPGKDRP